MSVKHSGLIAVNEGDVPDEEGEMIECRKVKSGKYRMKLDSLFKNCAWFYTFRNHFNLLRY